MPARPSARNVYQVQVELLHTEPKIWRRLLVPPHFTLRRFHQALQAAMGWTNSHLHEFRVGLQTYGAPDKDNDSFGITRRKDERHVLLRELLPHIGSRAFYTYDFGDSWEHEVALEKLRKFDPGAIYPVCIAGEMACPPEDCGGLPGYCQLLEAIRDPRHEQHAEVLELLGQGYDPLRFPLDQVNRRLQRLKSRA